MKPERQLEILDVTDMLELLPKLEVVGAPALGVPLLTNGHLGADLLCVGPDEAFPVHVHPGDHLLYIVEGWGTVYWGGQHYQTGPGMLCLIPADVEHGVTAGWRGQVIMAMGAPHKPVDSTERMQIVEEP